MHGGTTEVNRDSEPLITGTHKGAASATLNDPEYKHFRSFGVRAGLYIENTTRGIYGHVDTVSGHTLNVAWVSEGGGGDVTFGSDTLTFGSDDIYFSEAGVGSLLFSPGDTYKIYKTATKDSVISTNWCDLSRGWKSRQEELRDGWRADDIDLDRHNPGKVFGPGQPSSNKRHR